MLFRKTTFSVLGLFKLIKIFYVLLCFSILISCSKKSIDFDYNGHIYLKTKINDTVSGNFMYDTGAFDLMIDTSFSRINNLVFNDIHNTQMGGVGGSYQIVNLVNDTLTFSVDEKVNISYKTYLLGLKNILGKNTDGILGVKTFFDRAHKIDFVKKRISFNENSKSYDSIKITLEGDKVLVPVNFIIDQKEYSGKFVLDLGSSVTVLNSNNKIDFNSGSDFESIGGIGGKTKGKTIFFSDFELGKQSITNFPVDISVDKEGALSNKNYDGLLGNDILDDFDIIIDLKQSLLFLKPNIKNNKHGMYFYKSFSYIDRTNIDNSWLVSYIYLNTDAYKKGLRLNDKIVAIDNVPVTKLNRVAFYKGLKLNQKMELSLLRENEIVKINFILDKFLGAN